MILGSRGSIPRAIAGSESVNKLTHNKCIAIKGAGSPRQIITNIARTSAILLLNKKITVFLMLA